MAGLNISSSLNRRQSSSDKKHYLSLRFVLFLPFRCFFAWSLQSSSSTVKHTKAFHSNFRNAFPFFMRKTLREKLSARWISAKQLVKRGRCKLQTPIKGGDFGPKLTHLWLLIVRIIFSRAQNIVRPSDWLEIICVWKFTTAFWWVYLSMDVINDILCIRVCVHVWMIVVYYNDLKLLLHVESWLRLQIIHSLK